MAFDETINIIGKGNIGVIGCCGFGVSTLSRAIADTIHREIRIIVKPETPNFVRFQNNFKRNRT